MDPVFVFGSNREGRHGMGAAAFARRHRGALYGQAQGRQGNSYAIVTKELRRNKPPVTLAEVARGVDEFIAYAKATPHERYQVTPIGCGLAGFRVDQIAPLFVGRVPPNVILPPEFSASPATPEGGEDHG